MIDRSDLTRVRELISYATAMAKYPDRYPAGIVIRNIAVVFTTDWPLRDRIRLALKVVFR